MKRYISSNNRLPANADLDIKAIVYTLADFLDSKAKSSIYAIDVKSKPIHQSWPGPVNFDYTFTKFFNVVFNNPNNAKFEYEGIIKGDESMWSTSYWSDNSFLYCNPNTEMPAIFDLLPENITSITYTVDENSKDFSYTLNDTSLDIVGPLLKGVKSNNRRSIDDLPYDTRYWGYT